MPSTKRPHGLAVRTSPSHGESKAVGSDKETARFWRRVDRSNPDGCWPWTGASNNRGYGIFTVHYGHWTTHAYALTQVAGPRPVGLQAAHSCHNKLCCNPSHLRWATAKENAADSVAAGRQCTGEKNGRSKLTATIVADCRSRHASGETYTKLAMEFGVSARAIEYAVKGQTWPASTAEKTSAAPQPTSTLWPDSLRLWCQGMRRLQGLA